MAKKKAGKKPKTAPKPKGPTATCPECGDVREVTEYFDPRVHDERCPSCRMAAS